jgi:hypothetical protein
MKMQQQDKICLLCKGKGVIQHPLRNTDENGVLCTPYESLTEVNDSWLTQLKSFCEQSKKQTCVPTPYVISLVNEIWQLTYIALGQQLEIERLKDKYEPISLRGVTD